MKKALWMTREALKAVKAKRKAWNRYFYSGGPQQYEEFKVKRNIATAAVRNAQRNYEKRLAENIKTDPKSFWKLVRSKTHTKSTIGELQKENGEVATTDEDKAEALNNHYRKVFTTEDTSTIPVLKQRFVSTLDTIVIDQSTVDQQLQSLKTNCAAGPDGLPSLILKEAHAELAIPLSKIFQRTLDEEYLPNDWREANITPIYKRGNRTLPVNYRPVNLTSVVCKVMESIIRDYIMEHLIRNQIITDAQYGFTKGRSCALQLITAFEAWTSAVDDGYPVDITYLDFQKAFDTVPLQRLQMKLWSVGIRGQVHKWLCGFLNNRRQRLLVNGKQSSWQEVVSGVPQGSVLGPVLFLIFINDMPEEVNCLIHLFADDTKLSKVIQKSEDFTYMQDDLDALYNWSQK